MGNSDPIFNILLIHKDLLKEKSKNPVDNFCGPMHIGDLLLLNVNFQQPNSQDCHFIVTKSTRM